MGDGEGVGDQERCGVGGWEGAHAVHVREQIEHVGEAHLAGVGGVG